MINLKPLLVVVSGLPGVGKSALSEELARRLGATLLSVDPIEAALWQSGIGRNQPTGIAAYVVAGALAEEQLKIGRPVLIDAVSPVEESRAGWRAIARRRNARLAVVVVTCTDENLHRQRIEARVRDISGMPEVTWDRVQERRREYQPWRDPHLTIDSVLPVAEMADAAMRYLALTILI